MAKLTVTVEYDDVTLKAQPVANNSALNLSMANPSIALKTQETAQAILNVANIVAIDAPITDLISKDSANNLKLGSDNKLIVTGIAPERYSYMQSTPNIQWVVNHNLGVQPQITVLSMGGMLMLAEILHTSNNQAIIYFDSPTAGIANCI